MGLHRRRKYFIKKNFQGKFIFRFLFVSLLGMVLSIALFNIISVMRIDAVLYSMRIPEADMGALFFREAFYSSIVSLLIVIMMLIITAKGIFDRITGPLVTFRAEIQKLGRGDLSSMVILRQGDEFKDFAENLNKMTVVLNQRFSDMTGNIHNIAESVRELREMRDGMKSSAPIERIKRHINGLEEDLKTIKK